MSKQRWYVLHAYSGYEKKVADSIVEQANKLGISEHIDEVLVPTQHIVEVKRGVRINSERKIFPGYILIKMTLNEDTWHIIKKIIIIEEIKVSFFSGQVTFDISCRTCLTNCAGFVFLFSIFIYTFSYSILLAGVAGLEPAAPGFGDRCSTS